VAALTAMEDEDRMQTAEQAIEALKKLKVSVHA